MTAMVRTATTRKPSSDSGVGTVVRVLERGSERGSASEPEWLRAARQRAAAWIDANGFPSTKHEDWRCTKIDAALALPLVAPLDEPADNGRASASSSGLPVPHLGGPRVVVVNGRIVSELSTVGIPLRGGIRVESMAGAMEGFRTAPPLVRDTPRTHVLVIE